MDTIAAIASGGRAPAAIGIVRISGPACFAVCARIFRSGKPFGRLEPRRMALGELLDAGGRTIDRGLAVRFPGPHSYTGEDCAEFHCHGSPVVLGEVLLAALRNEELGAACTVWLAEEGAASLLAACGDPASALELIERRGL